MECSVTQTDLLADIEWHAAPDSLEYGRLVRWLKLRDDWLGAAKGSGRTTSGNTRRAYETATRQWLDALNAMPGGAVYPWLARAEHVRVWQNVMGKLQRLSDATINVRLAAVSSWYTFIVRDAPEEMAQNPFVASTVRRRRVRPYGQAHPLGPDRLRKLFTHSEAQCHTVGGARNHALLLTYFTTGCRVSEVVRMRWGDIRPSRSRPDEMIFLWEGKGGKREASPLPVQAYEAILRYAAMAGREPFADEYIWLPLADHGLANLWQESERLRPHISTTSANRVLHTCLRNAGFEDWRRYRIHDLRHSFAHQVYEATGDIHKVQKLLHHSNPTTTQIYISEMQDPVDDHSAAVWAAVMDCALVGGGDPDGKLTRSRQ
jgi:integrase